MPINRGTSRIKLLRRRSAIISDAAQTTAFLARADAITTVGATERAAYKTLINGLVADGDFGLLDFLYIFATDTQAHALLNLISSSFNGTANGTVSFSADHGFTGDSATFWIDSGFAPATAGGNFTATSASMGAYNLSSRTTGQGWISMGFTDTTGTGNPFIDIYPKFTDNNAYVQYSGNVSVAMTNAKGLMVGIRSSATAQAMWKFDGTNNGSIGSNSSATVGLGTSASTFGIFASNDVSSAQSHFSGDQLSAAFAGSGGINVANVSARINAYMTALGVNVY